MQQEEISALQLFYVIMGFTIGNAMIFGVGADAKQDAWLSILISMLCGLVLVWVYTKLSECYPGDTLVQMIPKIIGKYLSYPLIIVYIVYFTYLASRSCRDFGELVFSTILNQTPMFITIWKFYGGDDLLSSWRRCIIGPNGRNSVSCIHIGLGCYMASLL